MRFEQILRIARWGFATAAITALALVCGSVAGAHADEVVYACGPYPNNVFAPASNSANLQASQQCGEAGTTEHLNLITAGTTSSGQRAFWAAYPPAGLQIDDAQVISLQDDSVNARGGTYGGGFFWGPGGSDGVPVISTASSAGPFGVAQGSPGFPSSDFGIQIVCGAKSCDPGASLVVGQVDLTVGETQGPSISAGALWDRNGWVWGSWPISVAGDSPSGVCGYDASIGGDPVGAAAAYGVNQTVWHQCVSGGLSGTLNTAQAPNGADTLSVSDSDAAGLSNGASEALDVDNEPPTVSLSGPSTAASTAGAQEVAVSVSAGPSGPYGGDCSVNGGPSSFYRGASFDVAVDGLGPQTVTCTGLSNAVSASGAHESSNAASYTVDLQLPTEGAISFSHISDALRCRSAVVRVEKLGRSHVIRLHGHKVMVRRIRYVKRHVRKCSARTARRRVRVVLKHHGKVVRLHGRIVRAWRVERVVVLPHRVYKTQRTIGHGRSTTVSGLLLGSGGVALAGQPVTIYAAPDDGASVFAPVASATTNAYGVWVAKVPAGPSRLLEAVYGGTATQAGAVTPTVSLRVPAKLRIRYHTSRVAWGGTVLFSGQVNGGYIPAGGINLRLSYGYGHSWTTYGVLTHVEGNGSFRTSFTFGPGDPQHLYRFHFRFSTLPSGGYPWAPAGSNQVTVIVGGHPRVVVHHRRDHHRAKRAHRHHRGRTQHRVHRVVRHHKSAPRRAHGHKRRLDHRHHRRHVRHATHRRRHRHRRR